MADATATEQRFAQSIGAIRDMFVQAGVASGAIQYEITAQFIAVQAEWRQPQLDPEEVTLEEIARSDDGTALERIPSEMDPRSERALNSMPDTAVSAIQAELAEYDFRHCGFDFLETMAREFAKKR